ncbi:prepilin peptidase [Kordiimonas aquimaris]|uniref:prepilin peptidase n=1 Tax=Kordiimonas aquimaris TaxID=707591 RepID=UPI0021D19771|nr:A24 family peptidase [Kordiimonas aquimaris]
MQADNNQFDLHPVTIAAMTLIFGGPLVLLLITGQPLVLAMAVYVNMTALSFYDFREYRLPNLLTGSFFLLATGISYVFGPYAMQHHVIGAVLGAGLPLLLNTVYRHWRGRDGIGMGDIKLLAGAGMLLAWPALPLILSISSTLGIGYILLRHGPNRVKAGVTYIPFGPFIAFATITLWLFN